LSREGKVLASAYREVRLWDVATGEELLVIPEPREYLYAIYSVSFSPDGTRLASGGQDNAVIVWDAFGRDRNRRAPGVLPPRELESLWDDLAGPDPARAYRTGGTLAGGPPQAAPLPGRAPPPGP